MINVVLVSHSEMLVTGLIQLLEQVKQGECNIYNAAGIDDTQNPIGTDAIKIQQMIETALQASSEVEAVIVLMDMGSAILSAQTALELLEPEQTEKVVLSNAPLVEGAIAAVVSASLGSPLAEVLTEMEYALEAKTAHL